MYRVSSKWRFMSFMKEFNDGKYINSRVVLVYACRVDDSIAELRPDSGYVVEDSKDIRLTTNGPVLLTSSQSIELGPPHPIQMNPTLTTPLSPFVGWDIMKVANTNAATIVGVIDASRYENSHALTHLSPPYPALHFACHAGQRWSILSFFIFRFFSIFLVKLFRTEENENSALLSVLWIFGRYCQLCDWVRCCVFCIDACRMLPQENLISDLHSGQILRVVVTRNPPFAYFWLFASERDCMIGISKAERTWKFDLASWAHVRFIVFFSFCCYIFPFSLSLWHSLSFASFGQKSKYPLLGLPCPCDFWKSLSINFFWINILGC